MSGDESATRFRPSRRNFLKTGLAAGTVSLAGCPDRGAQESGADRSGTDLTFSGRIHDIEDSGVSGAAVAALATVALADGEGVTNRVLASGETDAQGQFEIPVTNFDPDTEQLARHASKIDIVLLAQQHPQQNTVFSDTGLTATWFGQTLISGSGVSGPDPPPLPGTEVEHSILMDKQVLYNGWQSSLEGTDVTVWRTVSAEDPSQQTINVEVRGIPAPIRGLGVDYAPLQDGELAVQLPDDRPDTLQVEYPSDQQFVPRWAKPHQADREQAKWFNLGTDVPVTSWETYSVADAYETARDGPFTPPLYEFFGRQSFSELTDERRDTVTASSSQSQFEQIDEDLANLFVSLVGNKLGDVGTALSAVNLSEDLVSYAFNEFNLPRDQSDTQFLSSATGPDMDENVYDSAVVSWPAAQREARPPAVVHQVPLRVQADAGNNRQEVTIRGFWRSPAETDTDARFEHAVTVNFAATTPPNATPDEQGTATPTPTPEPVTGQWPQRFADAQNTGYLDARGPTGDVEKEWTVNADEEYDGFFGTHYAPVTDGDMLYVATEYGPLLAVRPDGSVEWTFTKPRVVNGLNPSGLAVDDQHVYMTMSETTSGSFEGTRPAVYAVPKDTGSIDSADGGWTYSFPDLEFGGFTAVAKPTVANGLVYVFGIHTRDSPGPIGDAPLVALDAATGDLEWRQQVRGVIDDEAKVRHPPAVTETGVFLNTRDRFHAYDAATGDLLWESDDSGVSGFSLVAVVGETALFTGSLPDSEGERALVAYDISSVGSGTVEQAWTAFEDTFEVEPINPSVDPTTNTAYVTNPRPRNVDELWPVDTSTGETKEPFAEESVNGDETSLLPSAVTDNLVYLSDSFSTLVGFDRDSGERRLKLEHNGASGFIATGNRILIGGDELTGWSVAANSTGK